MFLTKIQMVFRILDTVCFFNAIKQILTRIVAHFDHVVLQATNDFLVGNLQKTMMLFKANVQPLNHASCFN